MLYSKSQNFIFIHTYKTAGTSIRHALSPYVHKAYPTISTLIDYSVRRKGCILIEFPAYQFQTNLKAIEYPIESQELSISRKLNDLFTKLKAPLAVIPAHIHAQEFHQLIGHTHFDRMYSFAFVRNPWAWHVSLYKYIMQTQSHWEYKTVCKLDSFESYLKWRVSENIKHQADFVLNNDGQIMVDFIGKYEQIDSDFRKIGNKIGIQTDLPTLNQSGKQDYQSYYNQTSKNLVKKYYQKDIELFGYTF